MCRVLQVSQAVRTSITVVSCAFLFLQRFAPHSPPFCLINSFSLHWGLETQALKFTRLGHQMTCKRLQKQYLLLYCFNSTPRVSICILSFQRAVHFSTWHVHNNKSRVYIRNSTLQEVVDIKMDKWKFSRLHVLHKISCPIWVILQNIVYLHSIHNLRTFSKTKQFVFTSSFHASCS